MAKQSFRITTPVREKQNKRLLGNLKELITLNELITHKTLDSLLTENEKGIRSEFSTKKILDNILIKAKNDELNELKIKEALQKEVIEKPLVRDLVMEFAEALMTNDIELLTSLLADSGQFVTINSKFELPIVGKREFITYLKRKLLKQPVTSFTNDFCNGCFKGKHIMFYNDGAFPWNVLKQGFGKKAAFKFTIENDKISMIRFCQKFMQKQNIMDYSKYKELYAKYSSQGYSIDDTVRLAKAEWNK